MTTIEVGQSVVTLVNVFTVAPEDQRALVDVLIEATEQVMRGRPGFVSANIHVSLDGTRVANYAQWRTREDFESILEDEEVAVHFRRCRELASNDAHLYDLVHVAHRC